MDEALDVVQRERQTETSLKEAFNFFFFFSGFSNKLFIAAVKSIPYAIIIKRAFHYHI